MAYTVLRAHGIDRGDQSALYLSGWAETVIQVQRVAFEQDMYSMHPTSRADVAKSVLGRVTAATKGILELTHPPGFGGKIAGPDLRLKIAPPTTYAGAGPAVRPDGPVMAGP